MENYQSEEGQRPPAQCGEPVAESGYEALDETEFPGGYELRQARLDDYRAAALTDEDPFTACLDLHNASLLSIGAEIETLVLGQLAAASPLTTDALANLQPAVDTLLRLSRQADRNAQTKLRGAAARERADAVKFQRKPSAPSQPRSQLRRN